MTQRGVLVVGGGLAGVMTALRLAKRGSHVMLVLPDSPTKGSSHYAQGGLAAVLPGTDDTLEAHVCDTIKAGAGLSDEKMVRFIVESAPRAVSILEEYGAKFDRQSGEYDRHREGGHSAFRVIHVADQTGAHLLKAVMDSLGQYSNIEILRGWDLAELIREDDEVCGAVIQRENTQMTLSASAVVLATGGAGGIFQTSTNPPQVWGSGVAIAAEMGAECADMAFVQFHPTALYVERVGRSPLVSEAVRGAGAILRDASGKAFMKDEHPDADLATRDIVARAIHKTARRDGRPYVHLDASSIQEFPEHFPGIYAALEAEGVSDLSKIPVAPAAHYTCGGIVTDERGATSLPGLYAVGECARTGLHGANRLASNSLLEAVVMAESTAAELEEISGKPQIVKECTVSSDSDRELCVAQEARIREEVSRVLGVLRRRSELEDAIASWEVEMEAWAKRKDECRSLARRYRIAIMIAEDSLRHAEDVGSLAWAEN